MRLPFSALLRTAIVAFGIVAGVIVVFNEFSPKKQNVPEQIVSNPTPTPTITNVGPFSVILPSGWRHDRQSETSSLVGTFIGDGITLLYDYGENVNELAREGDPKYSITYQTIDGRKAKIVRSNVSNQGLTGVYFGDAEGKKLQINAEKVPPTQVEQIISIFQTIDFTDK